MNEQAASHIPQQGFFEVVKRTISDWFAKLNLSWSILLELCVAGLIGAVIGFITRKIGRQLILGLVFIAIIVLLLQYFNFVTIEWPMIQEAFGLDTGQTMQDTVRRYIILLQNKLPIVIAALVGFFIGYKIG